MSGPVAFLLGVALIWLVSAGKAGRIWNEVTGARSGTGGQVGPRPPDPSSPYPIPPQLPGGQAGPTNPPGWG
jgi:hypothetical protein